MQVQIGLDEMDEEFEIYLDDEWFNATRLKEEGILNHISDVEYQRYGWCNPPTLPVPLLHLHPNFHVDVIISTITDLIDSFPYTWNPASNSPGIQSLFIKAWLLLIFIIFNHLKRQTNTPYR